VLYRKTSYRLTGSRWILSVLIAAICSLPLSARADDDTNQRVVQSGWVLKALLKDQNGLSPKLLSRAKCVIVLPSVKKGSLIIGASYGKGVMNCRTGPNFTGPWSAPIMVQSAGGSIGLQAGGQATDYVILAMNEEGAQNVLKGHVKLGAGVSVAAGPLGHDAEVATNPSLNADLLTYSRTQGVFAGASLSGTSLDPDSDSNQKLYGQKMTAQQIFDGGVKPPPSSRELMSLLEARNQTVSRK
jgi:SH3 domain-containing YSC84-like protein 1